MSEKNQFDQLQIEHVARLAKLQFSDLHQIEFQHQISKILEFVSQLNQVEIPAQTEPFFGADWTDRSSANENHDLGCNADRDDVSSLSLPLDDVLANAPQSDGQYFVVPPVFE